MKCLIKPKLFCFKQWKTGKGKWNYVPEICQDCVIFIKEKQIPLEVIQMGKQTALKWVASKKQELEEKRKLALKEKGYTDLYNMQIGETEITVDDTVEPRTIKTKYGDRDVLRIYIGNGKSPDTMKDWMINPNSPLYLTILENLSLGKTRMIIVRSGLEKLTRYSLKKAW